MSHATHPCHMKGKLWLLTHNFMAVIPSIYHAWLCSSCHSAHSSASNGNHYRHVLLETYRAGCAMSMSAIISITLRLEGVNTHTHTYTYTHTGTLGENYHLGLARTAAKENFRMKIPKQTFVQHLQTSSRRRKKTGERRQPGDIPTHVASGFCFHFSASFDIFKV